MKIQVTADDIEQATATDSYANCVARALRRRHPALPRNRCAARPYIGNIRFGNRTYDMDDEVAHYLILHMHGHAIAPFEFELDA